MRSSAFGTQAGLVATATNRILYIPTVSQSAQGILAAKVAHIDI